MKTIRAIFLRGLLTLLPIALTIYILSSVFSVFENMLGNVLRSFLPESSYIPGLGFVLALILIFFFGLLLNNLITNSLWSNAEKRFMSVPLIKAVYSPLRDLMNLFSTSGQKDLKSVVLVDMKNGAKVLGLVTRDNFTDLGIDRKHLDDRVAVYLPMSYGLGGFTLLIARHQLETVDIPVERALQLAITGWVTTHSEGPKQDDR
ncbi:MAG: DUF502 domain-containing protein [Bdellovibrionaceae bacterium]|nr:DUF502 domain-containing protein [Pseudobdellovibrionaceae bacterium]